MFFGKTNRQMKTDRRQTADDADHQSQTENALVFGRNKPDKNP